MLNKPYNSKLLESILYLEMAYTRQGAEYKITDLSYIILEHIIKILKWKDKRNLNKHISDINGWLKQIYQIKLTKNKKLKYQDYFNWLYAEIVDSRVPPSRVLKELENDYGTLKTKLSNQDVIDCLPYIYQNIAHQMTISNQTPTVASVMGKYLDQ